MIFLHFFHCNEGNRCVIGLKISGHINNLFADFIFVSVIMKDNYESYTVALGLFQMISRENVYAYFTRFCAGAAVVAVPITMLFLGLQRYYVEGVTGGAVKG